MASTSTFQNRLISAADSFWVLPVLLVIEIIETTIFPLPYEALFVALCAVAKSRIWLFVLITGIGSAIAGSIMYGLGASFAEPVAAWFGAEATLAELTAVIQERGASFILLGGTTPAPSYLINLAAGAAGFSFWQFLSIFFFSRTLRFAVLGAVIYFFGDTIATYWNRLPIWLRRGFWIVLIAALIYWFVSGFL
ncbi:MAG: VTT domain-containing protein [Pseudomonadota bacterium]